MRPEFWDPLLLCPELAGLELGRRPFAVRPMAREALPAVIEEPARLAGIAIDDGLVAQLVADTAGGEALPLLAYTLEQLAEGVSRGGRLLMSRYEQLGGVQGTLTRQADAALAEAVTAGGRGRDVVRAGPACGWSPSTKKATRRAGGYRGRSCPSRYGPNGRHS